MDNTKSQICKAARELFNEKGYQSVSMRQIAGATGVSLGTLTYHYAHKQDILAAIMDSTIETFPKAAPQNIADLRLLFRQLLKSITDAHFYFNDPSLYQSVPVLRNQSDINVGRLFDLLETALNNLVKNHLLMPELTERQIHQLTTVLMLSHTGWCQHNSSRSQKHQISMEDILDAQWVVLQPYLTQKGRDEYEKAEAISM